MLGRLPLEKIGECLSDLCAVQVLALKKVSRCLRVRAPCRFPTHTFVPSAAGRGMHQWKVS